MKTSSKTSRTLVLLSTLVTGASGLIYEVTWHKYLANLLGSQARASAIILAVFLGGLSIGYFLFGRLSRERSAKSMLMLVAWAEIGIGIWCYFFPTIYGQFWNYTKVLPPSNGFSLILDLLVSASLMGIPTVLMGGTLPLLTQALSRDLEDSSSFHAKLYSLNTGGAFIGCLLAGFYLIPYLGLTETMITTSYFNIAAGVFFIIISRTTDFKKEDSVNIKKTESARHLSIFQSSVCAFTAGFYAISLQVILMRLIALSVGSSEYAFSMCVAAFIFLLACGSWLASKQTYGPSSWLNQIVVSLGIILILITAEAWPYYAHVTRVVFTSHQLTFYLFHASIFFLLCLILLIPVGAMGRTLPLLFGEVRCKPSQLGTAVGGLYAWNTLGCVAGAIIGGYLLLYYLELQDIIIACCIIATISAFVVFPWKSFDKRAGFFLAISTLSVALTLFLSPAWSTTNLGIGQFRTMSARSWSFKGSTFFKTSRPSVYTQSFAEDGPNSSIRIMERKARSIESRALPSSKIVRTMYVNGKSDGETSGSDLETMRLIAHLPALLSSETIRNVAVVGFGLGVSAGSFTLYPEIEEVSIIEISPTLQKAAHLFDFANYNLTKNKKVNWEIGDAYRVLGGSEKRYSIIASEPSNPWVAGVERLFAAEFYELVKSKLTEKGIYCQWFHTYSMSEETMALVMKNFSDAFPNVRLFHSTSDIIALGSRHPIAKDSLKSLARRYEKNSSVREALSQSNRKSIESLLATELWIPSSFYKDSEKHTLEHPKLSYRAGKDFFLNKHIKDSDLLDRSDFQPWVRRYSTQLLIGYWLEMQDDFQQSLLSYTARLCEYPFQLNTLPPKWDKTDRACRESLVALLVFGIITPEGNFDPAELDFLKTFFSKIDTDDSFWKQLGKDTGVKHARGIISLYKAFDSALTPLSPQRLLFATESCGATKSTEAKDCLIQLSGALSSKGYGSLALLVYKQLVTTYESEFTQRERERLKKIVNNALTAETEITE